MSTFLSYYGHAVYGRMRWCQVLHRAIQKQTNPSPKHLDCARLSVLWGWGLFAFVWLCAILGTISSFRKLRDHSNLETLTFIGMGLSVLVAFKPLVDALETQSLVWIFAEGVMYITGALFYSLNKRKYMHTVFHFFVLAGSICHIIAVWGILMEYL